MKVKISKQDVIEASDLGIIDNEQAEALWTKFTEDPRKETPFTGVNVAYYFGAFIIMSAMTWFATEAFERFSARGLMLISIVYFAGLLYAGKKLFEKPETRIPGGLLITASVFMVPLLIFSIQHHFGVWQFDEPKQVRNVFDWISGGGFFMEIGTIVVSLILLIRFRFPFLTFPLALALWSVSMEISPIIYGDLAVSPKQRETVAMFFGLATLITTFFVDKYTEKDYAFWLYLFGLLSFWIGLSFMGTGSEWGFFVYFLINFGLVVISVILRRKAFLVFGAIGSFAYLGHLSETVFGDSIAFPVALTALGILIIFSGVKYTRNREAIEEFVNSMLPEALVDFLPPVRD